MTVAKIKQDEKESVFIEIISDLTQMEHCERVKIKDITQGVMLGKEAAAMKESKRGT